MSNPILSEALRLLRLGLSVIPIKPESKEASVGWTRFQTKRPSESSLRTWFRDGQNNLAVIFGEVSGNLAAMDFDQMEAFLLWERDHPELAQRLPIVETHRGRHVYFQVDTDDLRSTREALGSPHGKGAIDLQEGELRVGNCYCVLPPSIHPEGHQYRWIREPVFPLPVVALSEFIPAGCYREHREDRGQQRQLRTLVGEGKKSLQELLEQPELIQQLIEQTLPTTTGQRNRKLFRFARKLQAILEISDDQIADLKPIVREWHRQALPKIRTKPFEETWWDFRRGWKKVRYPDGEEPMQLIVEKAIKSDLPEIAKAYESPKVQLLIKISRELQRERGAEPFYLSCRRAGEELEISHKTANRYLQDLCEDGILREVEKGSQASRKASRYRYLHEL